MKSGASDPFADANGAEDAEEETSGPQDGDGAQTADGTAAVVDSTPQSDADEGSSAESVTVDASTSGSDESNGGRSATASTSRRLRDRDSHDSAAAAVDKSDSGSSANAGGGDRDAAGSDDDGFTREELPLVLRRDKVKDERPEVHQLFVQRETHDEAVDAERDLQDRLDDDLSRTDAREAIYLAGMEHLDDAEDVLRDWGYDL